MEGARISWDELTCVGYPVSENVTEKLCRDIESFREKARMTEHSVKKEQLINWKILKQNEGKLLATNAYALLTSDYFPFSKTQCAVFKGTDSELRLEYSENVDKLTDKQKETEAAQKEADKWMMISDTAKWQTEQAQIKLEEAESLKKELLGAVDGDDYLKE